MHIIAPNSVYRVATCPLLLSCYWIIWCYSCCSGIATATWRWPCRTFKMRPSISGCHVRIYRIVMVINYNNSAARLVVVAFKIATRIPLINYGLFRRPLQSGLPSMLAPALKYSFMQMGKNWCIRSTISWCEPVLVKALVSNIDTLRLLIAYLCIDYLTVSVN